MDADVLYQRKPSHSPLLLLPKILHELDNASKLFFLALFPALEALKPSIMLGLLSFSRIVVPDPQARLLISKRRAWVEGSKACKRPKA